MYFDTYFCTILSSCENESVYLRAIETLKGNFFVDIRRFKKRKSTEGIMLTPIEFIWVKKHLKNGFFERVKLKDPNSSIIIDHQIEEGIMLTHTVKRKKDLMSITRIIILNKEEKLNLIKNLTNITKVLITKKCF